MIGKRKSQTMYNIFGNIMSNRDDGYKE